jgi:hypothetical protein
MKKYCCTNDTLVEKRSFHQHQELSYPETNHPTPVQSPDAGGKGRWKMEATTWREFIFLA